MSEVMQKTCLRSTENPNDQDEEENICIEGMTKSNEKCQIRAWFFLIACFSCWITLFIFPKLRRSKWHGAVLGVGFLFGIGFSTTYNNDKLMIKLIRLFGVKLDL